MESKCRKHADFNDDAKPTLLIISLFFVCFFALGDTQITAARETSFKLAFCRKSIRCRQLLYSTAKDVSLPNLSINSSFFFLKRKPLVVFHRPRF